MSSIKPPTRKFTKVQLRDTVDGHNFTHCGICIDIGKGSGKPFFKAYSDLMGAKWYPLGRIAACPKEECDCHHAARSAWVDAERKGAPLAGKGSLGINTPPSNTGITRKQPLRGVQP